MLLSCQARDRSGANLAVGGDLLTAAWLRGADDDEAAGARLRGSATPAPDLRGKETLPPAGAALARSTSRPQLAAGNDAKNATRAGKTTGDTPPPPAKSGGGTLLASPSSGNLAKSPKKERAVATRRRRLDDVRVTDNLDGSYTMTYTLEATGKVG